MARSQHGAAAHPRHDERFLTTTLTCPIGDVIDVSRGGFRLRASKKPPLQIGHTHQIVLRTAAQQVRVAATVRWIRRVSRFPLRYDTGFEIVDQRPGVGEALAQLGQFGYISQGKVSAEAPKARPQPGAGARAAEEPPPDRPQILSAAMELDDLYAILGVASDADAATIKSAYRRLAQLHHPDHSKQANAAEQFDQVAKAYTVLGDEKRRAWYDEMRGGSAA
jgi:hypothetical protein